MQSIALVVRYCRCGTLLPLWYAIAAVVRYCRYTCSRLMHPIAVVVRYCRCGTLLPLAESAESQISRATD